MATFHFELVSPEKLVFSGEVDQVDVPGAEGDFGVLAGHAPLVSHAAARHPDRLRRRRADQQLVVLGGFAEVGPDGLTVLADIATVARGSRPRRAAGADRRDGSSASRSMAQGSALDRAIARLDHFKALDQHLHGTAMH